MRIIHIANFYGPNSGGIKTTLHELGRGYQAHGHEFIYIVPGVNYVEEITPFGRKITLPGFALPQSGGYRIIRNNAGLKKFLQNCNQIDLKCQIALRSPHWEVGRGRMGFLL